MAMTSSVADRIASLIRGRGPGTYAITGPAGSGKTHTTREVGRALGAAVYSLDLRFIGDSADRRTLLAKKQTSSLADYQDSANQFNWWDWAAVEGDLRDLGGGARVTIDAAYDRDTGSTSRAVTVDASAVVVVEGAILGPPHLVRRFERIFFLVTPADTRLRRILGKDLGRRSFNEVLARALITEYSETVHYRALFAWARDRIVFLDTTSARPVPPPELPVDLFLPVRVGERARRTADGSVSSRRASRADLPRRGAARARA